MPNCVEIRSPNYVAVLTQLGYDLNTTYTFMVSADIYASAFRGMQEFEGSFTILQLYKFKD